MLILAADIGNTLTKLAVFDNNQMVYTGQLEQVDAGDIEVLLSRYNVSKIIISTVKGHEEWQKQLSERYKVVMFDSYIKAGIINHYKTPHTLGTDRLAAVIGANSLYPATNNVVIGGGTCITYDFIGADRNYFGGSISPGLNMRYKAVNYYTAALPLLTADDSFEANYGDDTESAIRSGIQNGIKYELEGFINNYTKNGITANVILHGGDSIFFDTLLKNSIFAPYIKIEPYLVLKGLNAAIQKHND